MFGNVTQNFNSKMLLFLPTFHLFFILQPDSNGYIRSVSQYSEHDNITHLKLSDISRAKRRFIRISSTSRIHLFA